MNPAPDADAVWRAWMEHLLTGTAQVHGLDITGTPVYGWRDRSVGARADSPAGPRWIRIEAGEPQWARGDYWTGNSDASAIEGITKPVLLHSAEWDEADLRVRAEVMTFINEPPCSTTDFLEHELNLPDTWWRELSQSLGVLATIPTERTNADTHLVVDRVRTQLDVTLDPNTLQWETVHGDLHWANLCGPRFALLDWEGWGNGLAGVDAATLYCYSLATPKTAHRVHETFRDKLTGPAGTTAQMYAVARILSRTQLGEYPTLVETLHQHATSLTVLHFS